MNEPIENILARLDGVKRAGSRWMAKCPAHSDDKPSLQITPGEDGRALLKCFAGCETEAIVASLGMSMGDLFADDEPKKVQRETVYSYLNEAGMLLFQVVRKPDKTFPQRRPSGLGFSWGTEGVRKVLYHLPDLLLPPATETVYIAEGEKDVDNLRDLGFVATCNPGGAGKWREEYSHYLKGRHVVILPDNDESGRKHAEQVARSLTGVAASVKVLTLGDIPDKGDVSDWLAKGYTAQQLEELADATPLYGEAPGEVDRWAIKPLSTLETGGESLPWIWHGYLAGGAITLLTGLWKSGKSTLLTYLLATLGVEEWEFGGQATKGARVCIVTEETERTWAMRREEHLGLDDHIGVISKPFMRNATPEQWEQFITKLTAQVIAGGYSLVIFDSLPNLWAVRDENNAAEVRAALMLLNALVEANVAVLLVAHPRKGDAPEGQATRGTGQLPSFVNIIMEMRRYEPQNLMDTRRVLTSMSHHDETPVELVLEFERGVGYKNVGTRSEANAADRRAALWSILPDDGEGETLDELLDNWPHNVHKPARASLGFDLDNMASKAEVVRKGAGKRTDPYRYRRSHTDSRWVA